MVKEFFIKAIGKLFLLFPMAVCLNRVCSNSWESLVLLMVFAIGFCFIKFKGEKADE